MANTIQQQIVDYLGPACEGLEIEDVRIGLGYTSVRLNDKNTGLAWTAKEDPGCCTHVAKAGTLAGRPAFELLEMLSGNGNGLPRSLGLATANAVVAGLRPYPEATQKDAMDIINIQAEDNVVMVGYFGPVIPKLRKTGCVLNILELKPDKPDTIPSGKGRSLLASCTVAIITATSIITNTFDELIVALGNPRAVIILGPSSIMCPQVFSQTPVTHIGGARVLDAKAIERIVSEGGGTMILKPYLGFETICLNG
jgi:uncharacterized protein (DUF4213/DUF364 family)